MQRRRNAMSQGGGQNASRDRIRASSIAESRGCDAVFTIHVVKQAASHFAGK